MILKVEGTNRRERSVGSREEKGVGDVRAFRPRD